MPRLKLVPWERTWLDHPYLDLQAIYRRPHRDPETFDVMRDEDGFVIWNVVGPMTIRNHNKYRTKGFEYVTLGDVDSVVQAARPEIADRGAVPLGGGGREAGETAAWYLQQPGIRGPWDATTYLADQADERTARRERLIENIAAFGPDGAERFEQQTDPGYRLPKKYRTAAQTAAPEAPPKRKRGRPRKAQPAAEPEPATA